MMPYYEQDGIIIYHGDCREILPTLCPDVVLTDPPYNVGKDYGASQDDLSDAEYEELLICVAMATERQAWVTPTTRLPFYWRLLGDAARLVIIRKGAQGVYRYGWFDQLFPLLVRGDPYTKGPNLWEGIRLPGEGYFFREETFGHPGYTATPIMVRLVECMTKPVDLIVEPFAGTGTTLVAAKQCGRRAVGIEMNRSE